MSQNSIVLPTTGTVSGLQMTQDTNNALDTLNTLASGATAPSSPEAGQFWHDTTNNILKLRSLDNTTWIPFLYLNESAYLAGPPSLGQVSGSANRILNGGMQVDQFNEGSSYSLGTSNSPIYTADQWEAACESGTASGLTVQRVTDAPAGFSNSLKVTVGTGAGSVAAGDFLLLSQPIEANNLSDLNFGTSGAVPLSLSFWVKSSVAGTFSAVLQNAAGTRSLVHKFTIATTGLWTLITVPNIAGDSGGTWVTSGSAEMMSLFIGVATGTTYQQSTLDAWVGGTAFGSTSQTNGVLTTSGATFQLTGVMLNAGAFCSPYEKRLPQAELATLQRYYAKTISPGVPVSQAAGNTSALYSQPVGTSAGQLYIFWPFPVQQRTAPAVTTYNPAASNANWRDHSAGSDIVVSVDPASTVSANGVAIGSQTTALTVDHACIIHATANARM